jgi:uncharacterized protein (DUF1330 family)
MTIYVVAQLSFTDRTVYERYRARFMQVFRNYDGRLLAADEHPVVLEGQWDKDKIVLMSFPDENAARRFMDAPDYEEIARDRRAGASTVSLLVTGLANPELPS